MKHIVCFHTFNDYSGSPKVLKIVLDGLLKKGYKIDLVTSRGGVLDELSSPLLKIHHYSYHFSPNALVTIPRVLYVKAYTFFYAFRYLFKKDVVFYINTITPFGAALAARIMGKEIVYHYHENAFAKGRHYMFMAWLMQKLADRIICVSAYQASHLKRKEGVSVIPNALPEEFVSKLHPDADAAFERKTVMMLSSLKEYKGTREFIELASRMPDYRFVLVINDTQKNIDNYLNVNTLPPYDTVNITIYPRQSDVAMFYNQASVVLTLTNPAMAIETFGMTTLEAMTAGLPVVVPTVGGVAELVEDDFNGYRINVSNLTQIEQAIRTMLSNKQHYCCLAANALESARQYDFGYTLPHLENLITNQ